MERPMARTPEKDSPRSLTDRLVREIVSRVLAVSRPERIIVFGSAASGAMTSDSDIDLVVLASAVDNNRAESVRIGNALRGLGFPFDVFVMSSDRFEESKDVIGGLAYPAYRS